mmetsp:Transcript_9912/g.29414  ORF Transcript_9912/g.29414 Transcript_9912/m.29414 type:complete len:237 (+) Transcript_9912:274-984(+)
MRVSISIELASQMILFVLCEKCCINAISGELNDIGTRQPKSSLCLQIVIIHKAPKVSWIIRIHRYAQATVQHFPQGMVPHVLKYLESHVGHGAYRQRDPILHQPPHQFRILEAPYAVVDAIDAERIEGPPDVRRRTLLPRVGHREQSLPTSTIEHVPELLRRISHLVGVESDRVNFALEVQSVGGTQRLLESFHGIVHGQIPQEAHHESARDAESRSPLLERAAYPLRDCPEGHPP